MIETAHNGHAIRYDEDGDMWTCEGLGLKARSLAGMRVRINKIDADARRINAPVLLLTKYGSGADGKEANAVLVDVDKKHVFVMVGGRREKVAIDEVVVDTPENRSLFVDLHEAKAATRAASDRFDAVKKSIPRATADGLLKLGAEPKTADDE